MIILRGIATIELIIENPSPFKWLARINKPASDQQNAVISKKNTPFVLILFSIIQPLIMR